MTSFKKIFWRMLQLQKHNSTIKQFSVRNYFLKSYKSYGSLLWYFFGSLKFVKTPIPELVGVLKDFYLSLWLKIEYGVCLEWFLSRCFWDRNHDLPSTLAIMASAAWVQLIFPLIFSAGCKHSFSSRKFAPWCPRRENEKGRSVRVRDAIRKSERDYRSRRVAKTNLAVCLHRRAVQLHINEANEAWNQKKQLVDAGLLPLGFYLSLSLTYTQHYSYVPNQLIHYECPFCFLFLDPQLLALDALFSFQLITLLYSKAWFNMHFPIAYGGSVIHPQERNKDGLATQARCKKSDMRKKLSLASKSFLS